MLEEEDTKDNFPELLVELLLALVAKPSQLLRRVAQQAFTAFTNELTAGSLELLYDVRKSSWPACAVLTDTQVLASKESVAGQQELFDQDEASDIDDGVTGETKRKRKAEQTPSGSEAEDAPSESNDTVFESGPNDVNGDAQEASSGDEDMDTDSDNGEVSESDADDSKVDMDEEHAKLNAALAEIVKTKQFDIEMPDEEDDSSDTEEMDDEQMFELDERMAQVFRERLKGSTNKKQERKEARGNVVQFKNRALDFLEIYIKQESSQDLCLTTLLPLLTLIRTTRSKQLSERACGLIRTFSQKSKGSRDTTAASKHTASSQDPSQKPNIIREALKEDDNKKLAILRQIHTEVNRGGGARTHTNACSQASLILIKLLTREPPSHEPPGHDHDPSQQRKHQKKPREDDKDRDDRVSTNINKIMEIYADTQKNWLLGRKKNAVQPSFFVDFINWGVEFGKNHQK